MRWMRGIRRGLEGGEKVIQVRVMLRWGCGGMGGQNARRQPGTVAAGMVGRCRKTSQQQPHSSCGLLPNSISGLGVESVSGRSCVPSPPTRIRPFMSRCAGDGRDALRAAPGPQSRLLLADES